MNGLLVRARGFATVILLVATAAACADPPRTAVVDASTRDAAPPESDAEIDAGVDAATLPDGGPVVPLRVLFVGNSYTYFNDLPAVVRALGEATPGGAVEVESVTVAGAALSDHWMTTGARARIETGAFDAVVLQGQSLEPMVNGKSFAGFAALLSGAVSASGADGVWYATWARRAGDPSYVDFGLGTPESMTSTIERAYAAAAAVDDDVVARVGAAWQIARAELPEIELHDADGSHPTAAGTLLSACVIAQALTGRVPRVPEPAPLGLAAETAAALCAIAPRVRCLAGSSLCGDVCVDVTWNADHCGACDIACAGEDPCRSSVCGCDAGFTGCSERCVDLQTSPAQCGTCTNACSVGGVCVAGECACPRVSAQPITIEQLTALRPACNSWDAAGSLACNQAAHTHCAALDCFDSGFGPPSGHSPRIPSVMCVSGDVRATTYTALAAFVPACDGITERDGQVCATAISRYCISTGAVTGFGPVDAAGDDLTVTCLPTAILVRTTVAAVSAFATRCVPDPVTCSVASWSFCESMGHAGGFGPIEVSGTDIDVVCVDQ